MTDDKHSTKDKILGELESIKTLLDEERVENADGDPLVTTHTDLEDAPLLTDIVDSADPIPPAPITAPPAPIATPQAQDAPELPKSQATTRMTAASPEPSNKTENPFLPKHIRDRLQANRTLQRQAAADTTENSPKVMNTTKADEALVEEMLQRYLPRIEAELREKIRTMIKEERQSAQDP